jgi:hypothetical protein
LLSMTMIHRKRIFVCMRVRAPYTSTNIRVLVVVCRYQVTCLKRCCHYTLSPQM